MLGASLESGDAAVDARLRDGSHVGEVGLGGRESLMNDDGDILLGIEVSLVFPAGVAD